MPAFVREAMEKARVRAEQKFAKMAAPVMDTQPTGTAATLTDQPAGTAATLTDQPTGAAAQTVTTPPPTDPVGPDGLTDAQRTQLEAGIAAANAQKLSEVEAVSAQNEADIAAAAAAKSAPASASATGAATPTPYDGLIATAQDMATATDDPLAKIKFNQAMQTFGLQNQAAMDALKMRINADPSLRGQGAGTALLQMVARDAGMSLADLSGKLAVETVQRITEMNRYGFEKSQQLIAQREQYRKQRRDELLEAGDIDGWADAFEAETGLNVDRDIIKQQSPTTLALISNYADAIAKAIEDGNEARARELFGLMKALAPAQFGELTFEDYATAKDLWLAQNDLRNEVLLGVRAAIDAGDIATAINGLQSLYGEEESATKGRALLNGGMTLEEVNRLLTQAGYDEVASLDDMIGLEDELYISSELDKLIKKRGEADWKSQKVAYYQNWAKDIIGDVALTPEFAAAISEWLLAAEVSGGITFDDAGNPVINTDIIPPWDDMNHPVATLRYAWPLPGQTTFSSMLPDEAEDPELYARNEALNAAYIDYYKSTPSDKRLSREEWYRRVVEASGDDTGIDGWNFDLGDRGVRTPGMFDGVTSAAEAGTLIEGAASLADVDWDNKYVKEWVAKLPPTLPAAIKHAKSFADDNLGKIIKIGNQVYRVEDGVKRRSGYDGGWRNREYMVLTATDGTKVYMDSFGRITTIPPPPAPTKTEIKMAKNLNDAYEAIRIWFNSMEAP